MRFVFDLSAADRVVLLVLSAMLLMLGLAIVGGHPRMTRLLGLGCFLLIGTVTVLSLYAHL